MSYIGNQPPDIGAYDVQSFNGGGTSFTLQRSATVSSILLFIDGVRQTPTDAYTVSGVTLTTTGTTPSGTDNVTVMFMGDVVDIGMPTASGTPSSSTFLRGDMAWAAVVGGSITTEGDYFYNYNTISSDLTTTVATSKAAFVAGPITIADTYTWTISGELTMI
tara:strand:+ start:168 stop:656 length:489 start_codon:yes stop_codon:yes gene_type:complete